MKIRSFSVLLGLLFLSISTGCVKDSQLPTMEGDAAVVPVVDARLVDAEVPDPIVVRIATFNVKQFFDTTCDSGRCTAQSFEQVPTESEFEARARQLAQGIELLDADVVILQEIETQDCLTALKENLGDDYQTAILGETNGNASLDVGVLAKLPLVETVSHKDELIPLVDQAGSTYFTRDLLELHLDLGGAELIVFGSHFRSKYPPDDPSQRLAEASAAKEIVTTVARQNPNALIVLGGDLNDVPGSAPINTLDDGGELLRVASELGADAATYIYRGEGQAIDHLYHATTAGGSYTTGSAAVISNGTRGLAGSDHRGLRAEFSIIPQSTD